MKYGYGDLRVIVGKEEIRTFRYILCVCNETFRMLLHDPLFEEPLRLNDECSKESLFLLEKYYQGLEVEINNKNCIDLLSICVCYYEERMLKDVIDYIINNLDGCLAVGLLNKIVVLNNSSLKELREEFESFIKNENYKIMKNELLNGVYVDGMKFLFSNGIKFNGNEVDLLMLLLDYCRKLIDVEDKQEMKELIEECNFKSETLNCLNEDYKI